jgi:Golgi nucleoside diphosphatase
MLNFDSYKKLGEYVLMKSGTHNDEYLFEHIGMLRQIINERLHKQRKEDIPDICSEVKHLQMSYNEDIPS